MVLHGDSPRSASREWKVTETTTVEAEVNTCGSLLLMGLILGLIPSISTDSTIYIHVLGEAHQCRRSHLLVKGSNNQQWSITNEVNETHFNRQGLQCIPRTSHQAILERCFYDGSVRDVYQWSVGSTFFSFTHRIGYREH